MNIEIKEEILDVSKLASSNSDIQIYSNQNDLTTIYSRDELDNLELHHIDPKAYDLLELCLFNCKKIREDFTEDMKQICPDCELIAFRESENEKKIHFAFDLTNAYMNDQLKKSNLKRFLNQLMDDYDRIRTNLIRIGLNEFFVHAEEAFSRLCSNLLSKKSIEDQIKKIKLLYNADSIVEVTIKQKEFVEIYGYKKAVELFEEYVRNRLSKTKHVLTTIAKEKLTFKFSAKHDPRLNVFFKFNNLYFENFAKQLSEKFMGKASKQSDSSSIQISCQNDDLKSLANRNIEKLDLVFKWRSKCDDFIDIYLKNFSYEVFPMPFTKNDAKCNQLEYDSTKLEVSWLSETELELCGLQNEVNQFKDTVSQLFNQN